MLPLPHRRTLRHLDTILDGWRDHVPRRAIAFHKERQAIHNRAVTLLGKWWLLSGAKEAESLRAEVDALGLLIEEIERLIHDEVTAKALIHDLGPFAAPLGHAGLDATIHMWTQGWLARLADIGVHMGKADLLHDQSVLTQVVSEARDAREACELLIEAHGLLTKVEDSLRVQVARADYETWIARIRDSGPTAEIRVEMNRCLKPLRVTTPAPAPSPPAPSGGPAGPQPSDAGPASAGPRGSVAGPDDLARIARLFSEARKWAPPPPSPDAAAIEQLAAEWIQVQDNAKVARLDVLSELHDRMFALVERFRGTAGRTRNEQLRRLQVSYDHYRAVAGSDGPLETFITQLARLSAESPDGHADWIRKCEQANELLSDRATSKRPHLAEALRQSVEAIRSLHIDTASLPKSEAHDRQLSMVENAIEKIDETRRHTEDAREVLDAFILVEANRRRLETIAEEARELLRSLKVSCESLKERIETLREATDATGSASPIFRASPHSALRKDEPLDRSGARIAALEGEVLAAEHTFIASSRNELVDVAAETRRLGALLRRVPVPHVQDEVRDVTEGESPLCVSALLVEGRAVRATLVHQAQEERNRLLQLAAQATEKLRTGTTLASCSAEDRDAANEVAQALDVATLAHEDDVCAAVERLVEGLARWQTFHDRLNGPEIAARERARDLRDRLRKLDEERLADYHPRLTGRCSALLEGVPWTTGKWESIELQLAEAERLLGHLERQGHKLAARDLDTACRVLRAAETRNRGDSGRVARALDRLVPFERDQRLPPFEIRHAILKLAGDPSEHA